MQDTNLYVQCNQYFKKFLAHTHSHQEHTQKVIHWHSMSGRIYKWYLLLKLICRLFQIFYNKHVSI